MNLKLITHLHSLMFGQHIILFAKLRYSLSNRVVNVIQKVYILSNSPTSYLSRKIFALAFLFSSLSGWSVIPFWVYFSSGANLVDYLILVYFWFESVVPNNIIILISAGFKPWSENVHLFCMQRLFSPQQECIGISPGNQASFLASLVTIPS